MPTRKLSGSLTRETTDQDFWPGFVDALSSVLLVVIFTLIVFVVGQTHLSLRVSDQKTQLNETNQKLTRETIDKKKLWAQLSAANFNSHAMKQALLQSLNREMSLTQTIDTLKIQNVAHAQTLTEKEQVIQNLEHMVTELTAKTRNLKEESQSLQMKLSEVNALVSMAQKRSDFLMQVSKKLEKIKGIRQHDDRFVFDSNLLFKTASAKLTPAGMAKIKDLASIVQTILLELPNAIPWIVRVDGHTDTVPINNIRFKSNWELSFARAMSVVAVLEKQGIPAGRLAAAGFGEHHPVQDKANCYENRRIEIRIDSL
ncbi:MAG: OmpA family protein [Alphaproteobacteria bacterium]|nr:MAG: OmpA family protein [Alphaproteobacteria bacterium]